MNTDNIIINYTKVFLRIINRNSRIDFAKTEYSEKSGVYRVSVPVDNKKFYVVYSDNESIYPNDLVGVDFVLTLNPDLKTDFGRKVIKGVRNRDLSIRWIFPSNFRFSSVFHVYSPNFLKKVILRILFRLPLFGKYALTNFYIHIPPHNDAHIDFDAFDVIYGGVVGAHQKVVAFNSAARFEYTKLPIGSLAVESLFCEAKCLDVLAESDVSGHLPSFERVADGLAVSKINGAVDSKAKYGKLHHDFLMKMSKIYFEKGNTSLFDEAALFYRRSKNFQDDTLQKTLYESASRYQFLEFSNISTSFAHGDFTPWNVASCNGGLGVFDWEMGLQNAPLYFDFFHYVYYGSVLVDRLSFFPLLERLKVLHEKYFIDLESKEFIQYHFLYVYIQAFRHLQALESSNDKPVLQSSWLIQVWTDALIHFEFILQEAWHDSATY